MQEQFYLQSFLSLVINRTASLPVCVGFAVWVFRDINDFCAEFDVERNSQQAVTNFYLTKNEMFAQAGKRLLLPASFGCQCIGEGFQEHQHKGVPGQGGRTG